jgi:hypothetical protein
MRRSLRFRGSFTALVRTFEKSGALGSPAVARRWGTRLWPCRGSMLFWMIAWFTVILMRNGSLLEVSFWKDII